MKSFLNCHQHLLTYFPYTQTCRNKHDDSVNNLTYFSSKLIKRICFKWDNFSKQLVFHQTKQDRGGFTRIQRQNVLFWNLPTCPFLRSVTRRTFLSSSSEWRRVCAQNVKFNVQHTIKIQWIRATKFSCCLIWNYMSINLQ